MSLPHLQGFGHQKCLGVHLRAVLLSKFCKQRGIATHQARFEQRRLHGHVARAFCQTLGHGAHAGADLEPGIPAAPDKPLQLRTQRAACLGRDTLGQQQQHINVGIGKQLVAAKPPHSDQRQGVRQLRTLPQGLQQIACQG